MNQFGQSRLQSELTIWH